MSKEAQYVRLLKKYFGVDFNREETYGLTGLLYNLCDGHIRNNPRDPVFRHEFTIAKRALKLRDKCT
jgi:hypothetical protein